MTVYRATAATAARYMALLNRCATLGYSASMELIDVSGVVLEDVTDDVVTFQGGSSVPVVVDHDSAADSAPGALSFTTTRDFVWGRDIVRPWSTVTAQADVAETSGANPLTLAAGDSVTFPKGAYIVTSPENDMQPGSANVVRAFDKMYLLQTELADTFSAPSTITYAARVKTLLTTAGIPNADDGTGKLNPAVVRYPATWAAKKPSADSPLKTWPNDDSNKFTVIEIINDMLKASGCRSMYTDDYGVFVIEETPVPAKQSTRWTFSRNADHDPVLTSDSIVAAGNSRATDVWNVPNRIVYIQSGLTFDPTEGVGQYTINNSPGDPKHFHPGADQDTIGRVIATTRRLDASGQDDLVKQAEKDYTDTYADAESFTLRTVPWPAAGHFDVFLLEDDELPRTSTRKVQAQSWELDLTGGEMTWQVRTVADY